MKLQIGKYYSYNAKVKDFIDKTSKEKLVKFHVLCKVKSLIYGEGFISEVISGKICRITAMRMDDFDADICEITEQEWIDAIKNMEKK